MKYPFRKPVRALKAGRLFRKSGAFLMVCLSVWACAQIIRNRAVLSAKSVDLLESSTQTEPFSFQGLLSLSAAPLTAPLKNNINLLPIQQISDGDSIFFVPGGNNKTASAPFIPSSEYEKQVRAITLGASNSNMLSGSRIRLKNNSNKTYDYNDIMGVPFEISLESKDKGPQVLVYHTHATEGYNEFGGERYYTNISDRTEDNTKNVVGIGAVFCEQLEANGIGTVHITDQFDNPEYQGAYDRSLARIQQALTQYPTIKLIIDIHRDTVTEADAVKVRSSAQIDGQSAAQAMMVLGTGSKSLPVNNYKDNTKLAFQLYEKLDAKYPSLLRPIYATNYRYNQNALSGALLIEIGTDGNTFAEASLTARSVAGVLSEMLANGIH